MEIWKEVPNYEGIYQVSSLGRVKSLGNSRLKEPIIRKPSSTKGYLKIVFCVKTIKKTFEIHQLVAMAFLNHVPCGHRLEVDHINGIKTDNRLENLQVITHKQNCQKRVSK